MRRQRANSAAGGLALAAFFVAPALLVTFDAWRDPFRSWPGAEGDSYKFMDFFAWVPHAIGTLHNPLWMGVIDYPNGVNLAWETAVPLGGVVLWPVTSVFGPVVAYNVFIFVTICLDLAFTYLWLRRHTQSAWAAAIPSLLLGLGPWIGVHIIHPNLLAFWPLPLLLIVIEDVLVGRGTAVIAGLKGGLLVAAELYLAEELVVLALITVLIGLLALVLVGPRVRPDFARFATAALSGLAVAVILGGPMVAYQLLGPRAVHGPIQPFNMYVADLQNFILPTAKTWLWPGGSAASTSWTGLGEATAYVGAGLLLAALLVAVRGWEDPIIRIVAVTTMLVGVLSLGPRLHIGGVVTGLRLPGLVFSHLPLLDNILPVRFSLFVDLGAAFLASAAIDRGLNGRSVADRLPAAVAVVGVAMTLSVVPIATSSATIPSLFARGGPAGRLPNGTVALIGPYIDDGGATAVPMLWQAESGYSFSLIDGLAITVNVDGGPTWLPDNPIRAAFHQIQVAGEVPPQTEATRVQLLAYMRSRGVTIIILGPMPHRADAIQFVTWLEGRPPDERGGVSVWSQV